MILVRRAALLEWGARNELKKKGLLVVYCYGYVVFNSWIARMRKSEL